MPQRRLLLAEIEKFVALRSPKAAGERTAAMRRQEYDDYSQHLARPLPKWIDVQDVKIPIRTGHVPVRIYQPKAMLELAAPTVVYFHGGGFVVGNLDSSEVIAAGIAELANCKVVNVDYPLSPERPFPGALDASYECIEWLERHGASLQLDGSQMVLTGDSCGGNLVAALCIAARDRNGPKIKGQVLVNPWLSAQMDTWSRKEFSDGYGLNNAGILYYLDAYVGSDESLRRNELAFPLNCRNLAGLPPAWIHVAECDPLTADGRDYAKKLIDAGINVQYREARECVHAFLRARHMGPGVEEEFRAYASFVADAIA